MICVSRNNKSQACTVVGRFLLRYGSPESRPHLFTTLFSDFDMKEAIMHCANHRDTQDRLALIDDLGRCLEWTTKTDVRAFYDENQRCPQTQTRFVQWTLDELRDLVGPSVGGVQLSAVCALMVGCVKYGVDDRLCSHYFLADPILARYWVPELQRIDGKKLAELLANVLELVRDASAQDEVEAGECSDPEASRRSCPPWGYAPRSRGHFGSPAGPAKYYGRNRRQYPADFSLSAKRRWRCAVAGTGVVPQSRSSVG